MSSGLSRTGDIGIGTCPCHQTPVSYTTIFISSNPNVTVDGIPAITVGDIGISTCGHSTIALSGAGNSSINSKPPHRVGDVGQNCGAYVTITGSPTGDSI